LGRGIKAGSKLLGAGKTTKAIKARRISRKAAKTIKVPKAKKVKPPRKSVPKGAKAKRVARKIGRGTKKTARVGLGGSLGAPFAVGIPSAAIEGDPKALLKELEGTGKLASVLGSAGKKAQDVVGGVPGNALRDLIELPAQAVPSVIIPASAAFQAAKGDSKKANQLWEDYKKTGIIPGFIDSPKEGVKRLGKHPVYGALELSGAKAVVGRGAGAAARSGAAGRKAKRAASTKRADLQMYPSALADKTGKNPRVARNYSRDVINKAIQVAAEKRQAKKVGERNVMTRSQRQRFIRETVDETQAISVGRQQRRRAEAFTESEKALGRPKAFNRLVRRQKRPGAQAGVDALVGSGIARSPKTFRQDVAKYRETLVKAEKEAKAANEHVQAREARAARKTVEKVLANKNIDVEGAFAGVRRYEADVAKPQEREMVERGLIDETRLGAKNVPAGVVHEGLEYRGGRFYAPRREGEIGPAETPVSLRQVGERLSEKGVEPTFFSQARPKIGRASCRERV